MIPKKIHYCWFGGKEKSDFIKKCIQTWKDKLKDYEIIEWNESNFDVNICDFTKKAYENRKWAFVADYARLYALYNCGGIYLDTDVEMVKEFNDELLSQSAFLGFEDLNHVSTACIGSEKENKFIKDCMAYYDQIHYQKEDELSMIPNSEIIYNKLFPNGVDDIKNNQRLDYAMVYSVDYFSPKEYGSKKIKSTNNTVCIHHFDGTWKTKKDKFKDKIKFFAKKILGNKLYESLKNKLKRKKA